MKNINAYCGKCGEEQDTRAWINKRNSDNGAKERCNNCSAVQDTTRFFHAYDESVSRGENPVHEREQETLYKMATESEYDTRTADRRRNALRKLDEKRLMRFVGRKQKESDFFRDELEIILDGLGESGNIVSVFEKFSDKSTKDYLGNCIPERVLKRTFARLSDEHLERIVDYGSMEIGFQAMNAASYEILKRHEQRDNYAQERIVKEPETEEKSEGIRGKKSIISYFWPGNWFANLSK